MNGSSKVPLARSPEPLNRLDLLSFDTINIEMMHGKRKLVSVNVLVRALFTRCSYTLNQKIILLIFNSIKKSRTI